MKTEEKVKYIELFEKNQKAKAAHNQHIERYIANIHCTLSDFTILDCQFYDQIEAFFSIFDHLLFTKFVSHTVPSTVTFH